MCAMPERGYVSTYLTHFVGQREPDDEHRYALLVDILTKTDREGKLRLLPGGKEE